MYLAELRLTLALLGYEVGRKRCALTKEELLHLLHDDLLVRAIRRVLPGTRSRPTARWWVRINSTKVRSGRGWWPAAVRVGRAEGAPALRPRLRSWRAAAVSRLPRRSRCATRRPWPRAAPRLQGRTGAGQPCGPSLPTDSSAPPAGRVRSRRYAVAELPAGATRRESAGGW